MSAKLAHLEEERRRLRKIEGEDGEPIADPLEHARKKLKLPTLRRVVKRAKRDALYDLELEDGTLIPIGGIGQLKDPRKVEEAVADVADEMPQYYSGPKFRPIVNCLLAIAELEDSGVTPDTVTLGWLAGVFPDEATRVIDLESDDDRRLALSSDVGAFKREDDATLYIYLPAFELQLKRRLQVLATQRDLAARLARLGFEQVWVQERRRGHEQNVRKRRYWRSPVGFDPHGESVGYSPYH